MAVALWGRRWTKSHVLVKCDNMAVVNILHTQTNKEPVIMHLLRSSTIKFPMPSERDANPASSSETTGVSPTGLVISQLETQAQRLIDSGLAQSTKKVYSSAIAIYLSFCTRLNLAPVPASENTLTLFVAELFQTKAYNTVHTYLAGVRLLHVVSGTRSLQIKHFVCS